MLCLGPARSVFRAVLCQLMILRFPLLIAIGFGCEMCLIIPVMKGSLNVTS